MYGREGDGDEDEDDKTEEERAARRKAKGKGKASSPPEEPDSNDEQQIKSPRDTRADPTALGSIPEADTDTDPDTNMDVDMDSYWARQVHEASEFTARAEFPGYGHEMQFGDADADMNDALYSHPPSPSSFSSPSPSDDNDKEAKKAGKRAPNNSPERGAPGASDQGDMARRFAELQRQQLGGGGRGRGRGRGMGSGWGLAWQETMTQEKVEKQGWVAHDSPPSSPSVEQTVLEESAWEVYDPAAWEAAAERAKENVTLKQPHATLSVKPSNAKEKGEGSIKHTVGPEQSVELVRAVRSYKAIVRGTYLSYDKDDVMRVLHRDREGSLMHHLRRYVGELY